MTLTLRRFLVDFVDQFVRGFVNGFVVRGFEYQFSIADLGDDLLLNFRVDVDGNVIGLSFESLGTVSFELYDVYSFEDLKRGVSINRNFFVDAFSAVVRRGLTDLTYLLDSRDFEDNFRIFLNSLGLGINFTSSTYVVDLFHVFYHDFIRFIRDGFGVSNVDWFILWFLNFRLGDFLNRDFDISFSLDDVEFEVYVGDVVNGLVDEKVVSKVVEFGVFGFEVGKGGIVVLPSFDVDREILLKNLLPRLFPVFKIGNTRYTFVLGVLHKGHRVDTVFTKLINTYLSELINYVRFVKTLLRLDLKTLLLEIAKVDEVHLIKTIHELYKNPELTKQITLIS